MYIETKTIIHCDDKSIIEITKRDDTIDIEHNDPTNGLSGSIQIDTSIITTLCSILGDMNDR